MRVSRTTGIVGGIALIALGVWGALIPFVGPYFNYGFTPNTAWHFTLNRLWLEILPGAAVVLGGLILIASARRASGVLGGWLALAGGIWFIVGPSISLVWGTPVGGLLHSGVGAPIGGHDRAAAEAIGMFYGLGILITALAVFAIARFVSRPALAEPGVAPPARRAPATEPALQGTRAEPPSRTRERERAAVR
jgi:hypothetical protein